MKKLTDRLGTETLDRDDHDRGNSQSAFPDEWNARFEKFHRRPQAYLVSAKGKTV